MEIDLIHYIEAKVPRLKRKIFAGYTREVKKLSAVYFITHHTKDHVNESQLELRILSPKYDHAMEIESEIDAALAHLSGSAFTIYGSTKFHSVRSGGGCLYREDVKLYENTLYYNIKWRTING